MKQFLKRYSGTALALTLACTLCSSAFAAGTLEHFCAQRSYEAPFSDVSGWYESYVVYGYELGMLDGCGDGRFEPNSSVTVGAALKLAAELHSIYETGTAEFEQGEPWWQVYEDYCLAAGMIEAPYADHSNAISRGEFAKLLAAALPEKALTAMNEVEDGDIPDVNLHDSYGAAVYQLYRAGVLTGSDSQGSFKPQMNLRRSEMAAILARMVDVSARKSVSFGGTLNAAQIYAKCAPAVFVLEAYDEEGERIAYGSGVFLSENGEAVSNFHVIDGAASLKAVTSDGETYDVTGIYGYDTENDLIAFQVAGDGFTPMAVDYSGAQITGETVYTIGNPQGLKGSLSTGIISTVRRTVNGVSYIQTTAPISSGSSGGALIDAQGHLIGITSASISDGQNLNLAIPITALLDVEKGECRSVSAVLDEFVTKLCDGFTLSREKVFLSPDGTATITCSVPGVLSGYSVSFEMEERGIVQCAWGTWQENDSVELTLTGLAEGKTTVTISLKNRLSETLGTRTIEVTVR